MMLVGCGHRAEVLDEGPVREAEHALGMFAIDHEVRRRRSQQVVDIEFCHGHIQHDRIGDMQPDAFHPGESPPQRESQRLQQWEEFRPGRGDPIDRRREQRSVIPRQQFGPRVRLRSKSFRHCKTHTLSEPRGQQWRGRVDYSAGWMEWVMLRGGVFVGVNRTGGEFPKLRAAAAGAQMMYDWAVDPDRGAMDKSNVHVINDADGEKVVTPDDVTAAVDAVINNGVDQLILYFSGHGLLVNLKETWLLTEAPKKGNAAISVAQSIDDASRGRTPHVVIVSDACRTPAREIVTQSITAVSAFPNEDIGGPRKRVDVFYASAPGQAALELNTVSAQGIFTSILHDALNGILHEAAGRERLVLEPGSDEDTFWYVWSGPLGEYLEVAVGERLYELNINKDQAPWFDVRYGKANLRWLARVPPEIGAANIPAIRQAGTEEVPSNPLNIQTLTEIADDLVTTVSEQPDHIPFELERASRARAPGANDFIESIRSLAQPFPDTEDQFPIRVRGAQLVFVYSRSIQSLGANPPGGKTSRPTNIVVEFSNGTVTVLPVLPGYVTEVSVRDKQIVAVWFARVEAGDVEGETERLRQLRAIITASVQRGRFRLAENGLDVARSLQRHKGDDPSLAVYAAYSFYELRELERLRRMNSALRDQLHGLTLFDVGLLTDSLLRESGGFVEYRADRVPFFPMLSQGWELLDRLEDGRRFGYSYEHADTSRLSLSRVKSAMLPSLWTVFDRRARDELTDITRQGEENYD